MELNLQPIELEGVSKERPLIIAGPCSADILVKKKDDTATNHYACNGKYKLPCCKSHRN